MQEGRYNFTSVGITDAKPVSSPWQLALIMQPCTYNLQTQYQMHFHHHVLFHCWANYQMFSFFHFHYIELNSATANQCTSDVKICEQWQGYIQWKWRNWWQGDAQVSRHGIWFTSNLQKLDNYQKPNFQQYLCG